jgi:MFS transporter, SP family, general alpha glucoside:H+ symporter
MSEKHVQEISHVEADGNFDRSWRDENWDGRALSVAAQDVSMEEKDMTIRQALSANRMAVIWSLVISTCVIMEGYDTNLLGNFYAYRVLFSASPTCKILTII